ncbi:MAG: hypothetical protein LBU60_03835 [Clostridiales bacterium]|nr:hypothetical protein [Clostridiales bacterium]
MEANGGFGVHEYELDSHRFFDRGTTLFSVKNTDQTKIDKVVSWLYSQIGRKYNAVSPTWELNYSGGINCSTLVWAAYMQVGINIINAPVSIT